MYQNAEDVAIHELAQAVLLLIQLLQQKQPSEKEQKVLDKASKLAKKSIEHVT